MSIQFFKHLITFALFFCFGSAIADALLQQWFACFILIVCIMININTYYNVLEYETHKKQGVINE